MTANTIDSLGMRPWLFERLQPRARCLAVFCLLALSACAPTKRQTTDDDRYRAWLADGHAADVEHYRAYLMEQGVGDAMPMSALLRTARSWQQCGNREFSVPPRELWPQMAPTLRLVARLRDEGLLDPWLARSVYRDPELNRCAGGAKGSKHLRNTAADFDLPPSDDNVARLCAFWREHGEVLGMGLGFYTPTAIHVDTAGYRTWGSDHTHRTSLCLQ
jgi:uncharacterized protein YcbK (DUF882 family)